MTTLLITEEIESHLREMSATGIGTSADASITVERLVMRLDAPLAPDTLNKIIALLNRPVRRRRSDAGKQRAGK